MKSGTPSHPKVRRLARRLGIPRAHAVGLLCWLWDSAERLCPAGDIGRLEDADIAEEVMWEGDPAALVSAFVTEQLFDRNDTHRLIIHDWAEHCSAFVHRKVARAGHTFADGTAPNMGFLTAAEREAYQKVHPELQQTQPLTGVQPPNNRRITAEQPPNNRRTTAVQPPKLRRNRIPPNPRPDLDPPIPLPLPPPRPKQPKEWANLHLNPTGMGKPKEPNSLPPELQARIEHLVDIAPDNPTTPEYATEPSKPTPEPVDRDAVLAGLSTADQAALESVRQRRDAQQPKPDLPPMAVAVDQATASPASPTADASPTIEAVLALCTDRDPHVWRPWLSSTIPDIFAAQGAVELEDALRYVAGCANPSTRAAKGLGALKAPGRYLIKQVCSILKARKLNWPAFPEVIE